jgi:hypothetical protein
MGGKRGIYCACHIFETSSVTLTFFLFLLWAYHKLHPWEVSANSHFQNNYWWIALNCKQVACDSFEQKLCSVNRPLWNYLGEVLRFYKSHCGHKDAWIRPIRLQLVQIESCETRLRARFWWIISVLFELVWKVATDSDEWHILWQCQWLKSPKAGISGQKLRIWLTSMTMLFKPCPWGLY